jgi:hypothetical protein
LNHEKPKLILNENKQPRKKKRNKKINNKETEQTA